MLGGLSSLLVLLGVIIYAILSTVYASFYEALGVDPNDVGLGYANVLAHSVSYVGYVLGIAAVSGLLFVVSVTIIEVASKVLREYRYGSATEPRPRLSWVAADSLHEFLEDSLPGGARPSRIIVVIVVTIVIFSVLLGYGATQGIAAGHIAADVRAGHPIIPRTATPFGIKILAVRADPVLVWAAGKPDDAPAVEKLVNRTDLLYLGQANSTIVLYDPRQHQAIYLPASTVMLSIGACRSPHSNSRCTHGVRF
jgi:hypothetical protein